MFAGDGQLISRWGRLHEAADVPATMLVGVYRAGDETLRLHEYSPKFDAERFAAHERFFVEDVGTWTRSHFGVSLPSERTAVFGVSASGELALALGRRPRASMEKPVTWPGLLIPSPPLAGPPRVPKSLTSARSAKR